MSNIWFEKDEFKVTFRLGENNTELHFVQIRKEHSLFFTKCGSNSRELQHALLVADIKKKKRK